MKKSPSDSNINLPCRPSIIDFYIAIGNNSALPRIGSGLYMK